MKVLFVIPRLDPGGAAKQLGLLAAHLPRERFESRICVLGPDTSWSERLRKAGVKVEALGWRRWFDLGALARLQRLVQEFRPDLIHAWRPAALRAIGCLGAPPARRIVSDPSLPMNRLDRWLSRRVERVIVSGPAWAERCRRDGTATEKLVVIPPAVEVEKPVDAPPAEIAGLDRQVRCVVCVGPLQVHKGFRDAIWALDILRYVADDLHLLLVGDGPDRARLRQFSHDSRTADLVHMPGTRDDVPAWLRRAEIAWVPSRAPGGVNVALEAMAAGRPVVAANLPELAEVVVDGQTGFLVPSGSPTALARQTRVLLDNASLRQQFGEAGRQRAARHFAVADLVRRFADLYDNRKG